MKINFQQPLNPQQLKRIESIHGGFLYQHLFTVGCILLAPGSQVRSIQPERDEDIELTFDDRRVYIQAKKRANNLQHSDIKETLGRFDDIRNAHSTGERSGGCEFWIVSNVSPSTTLAKMIKSGEIASDIRFNYAGCNQDQIPDYLPPAWCSIEDAIKWCAERADTIPFCKLAGKTLVWKLAALVQYASTGTDQLPGHSFNINELPSLFEQLAVQLQRFPISVTAYYPQDNEPDFISESRVRLIVGLSGSGKTTWASESAVFCDSNAVYFDIGDTPSSALASTLSRELAGHFSQKDGYELGNILLPGLIGLDSIRALDIELSKRDVPVIIVVDNTHRAIPTDLSDIIRATSSISWIFLSQPTPEEKEFADLLQVEEETLNGWSTDTIATLFASEDCRIDPVTAERISRLTGRIPLYILDFLKLSKRYYGNNAELLCDDLAAMKHTSKTSQERILTKVCERLAPTVHRVMAILSISDVSLSGEEVLKMTSEPLGISGRDVSSALREMIEWGIVQQLHSREITMHDTYRLIATHFLTTISSEIVGHARKTLSNILETSILATPNISRQRFYLRLLPLVEEIKTLIDLSSNDSEFFAELGFATEIKTTLREAVDSGDLGCEECFWALDSLAFWAFPSGDLDLVEAYVSRMEELLPEFDAGRREETALAIKQMLFSMGKNDLDSASDCFARACELNKEHPEALRILRYNYAVCLYSAERYAEAETEAEQLVKEYYDVLGLSPEDIFAKNPPDIWPKIKNPSTCHDDLKRLADTLDLFAKSRNEQKLDSVLARIHAFKFYTMVSAWISAVRLGQDYVDEQLSRGDSEGAKSFLEQFLIPGIKDLKLLEHFIPVRAQYAVVLAYCGETSKAAAEIKSLRKFSISNPIYKEEFENQCGLIDKIIKGEVSLPRRKRVLPLHDMDPIIDWPERKIGRNESCPCGSGKKYKHCHGRL